ncbi:membrane protein [Sphaerisporangium krabiense]|nr:membrane protein [Sphaerisporangium krabiense]
MMAGESSMSGEKTVAGGGGRFKVTPGMRRLGASVLGMEAIVLGLVTPVAIVINKVSPGVAVTVGLGLAVACVVVAGMLKRPFAYIAGSVVQVLAIATGFLVPIMFFLGVVFAALWITAIFVARRVEGVT